VRVVPPDELLLPLRLRELLARFVEPLLDPLLAREAVERARERLELEPLRDRCPDERRRLPPPCWFLPSSSSLPSSFLPTATAAGTATPTAAPAATFLRVDMPSFPSSISAISTSSSLSGQLPPLASLNELDEAGHDLLANKLGPVFGEVLAGRSGRVALTRKSGKTGAAVLLPRSVG
jgi:hypothetical protein